MRYSSFNMIFTIILVISIQSGGYAHTITTSDLKPPQARLGIGLEPEVLKPPVPKMASLIKTRRVITSKELTKNVAYFDLDNKKIAYEIADELSDEQEAILEDLRILWLAAAENSETIKFAIYKLSNPEGEKVDKNMMKKILNPIASVAPMIGAGIGDAYAASSSILGGGLLSSVLADDSAINKELSKVTDADLVILAKEVDDIQQKLVELYYNYVTAFKVLNYSDRIVSNRHTYYEAVSKKNSENVCIADAFYREALDSQYKARQDLLSRRADLEQFVGNDALIVVETNLKARLAKIN